MEVKTFTSSSIEEEKDETPDIKYSISGTEIFTSFAKVTQKISKIEDLYPEIQSSSRLGTILNLLDKSIENIRLAKQELENGNEIYSDVYVLEFQGFLDELFCNRDLGDGFGIIINSFISIFENLKGSFLNLSQITTILRILVVFREKPFITENESLDFSQILEDADLNVEPSGFDNLVDFLTDEELH